MKPGEYYLNKGRPKTLYMIIEVYPSHHDTNYHNVWNINRCEVYSIQYGFENLRQETILSIFEKLE